MLNHVRAGQDVVTREIESAGFELIEVQELMHSQFFLRLRKRPQ